MKKKHILLAAVVILGIVLIAFGAWMIYDSMTGGQGRWFYLMMPVTTYIILCVLLYRNLKESKGEE